MSVAPLRLAPNQRMLNRLLDDIQAALPVCRRSWWVTRRTTCLTNQWVTLPGPGMIEPASGPTSSARQIADASYEPGIERLRLTFADQTIADVGVPS